MVSMCTFTCQFLAPLHGAAETPCQSNSVDSLAMLASLPRAHDHTAGFPPVLCTWGASTSSGPVCLRLRIMRGDSTKLLECPHSS